MVESIEKTTTVLIVDDEPGLVELLSAYLEPYCETVTAISGAEAFESVDESIDIAFLDRRMPETSGDEVLSDIRAAGHCFPVAMLTAVQADVDIIEMPFDAYVSKPVSGDEFLNLVDELVRLKDYDERSREFFRIASKKRSLELNPKVDTGEDSALHVLVTRMEALQKDLNGTLEGLIEEDTAQISEPD